MDKAVQGADPLSKAGLNLQPLLTPQNAWDEIKRPASVDGAVLLGVNREGDTLFLDRALQTRAAIGEGL